MIVTDIANQLIAYIHAVDATTNPTAVILALYAPPITIAMMVGLVKAWKH